MKDNHATRRRPGHWLAIAVAAIALPLLAACAATAESESTASMAHGDSGAGNAAAPADAIVINLPIAGRETPLTRDDLRVSQGDTVRLSITADESGEVHLHGYDLSARVAPDQPGELVFTAETAGAFALNFHVFAADSTAGNMAGGHHGIAEPEAVALASPASVAITANAEPDGSVKVSINTEGFRFEPESVDQAHTPGAGHAHIYVDGEKLGRVFESSYSIESLPPGEHEIRVSLNANDHRDLTYDGRKLEATTTVSVPDMGQGQSESAGGDGASGGHHNGGQDGDGSGHHGAGQDDDGEATAIIAEVHLGNLEVYP